MTHLRPALILLVVLTVVTGVIYPVIVTVIAQVVFPHQANGSLIVKDGKVVGSELIGQPFDDPKYFWSRPSATSPFGYNAASSSGSNLSPTNPALIKSVEGAEDDVNAGMAAMDTAQVTPADVVVGIAASGTTPYVRAALSRAQTIGAKTVIVSCSPPPKLLLETCDVAIVPIVGPEALTGSTRMKAGTATKLVLNTISTGAMVRSGRAYGNLMVDLMAWSEKLHDRGERIVMEACAVDRERARAAITAAGGSVKLAIVMVKAGVDKDAAAALLERAGGLVRKAIGDPPPATEIVRK
jgi:N-acetylmuramic acid 6-phosphate etherase